MGTDREPNLADGANTRFLLKEETHAIIGCAFEVLNELGHGLYEKIYENALVVEFGLQSIRCEQQRRFDVYYKKQPVGFYVPDLIAFAQVIVDSKTIEKITEEERGKMINYLKITGLRVGLILNFKHPKLEFERIVRSLPIPQMDTDGHECRNVVPGIDVGRRTPCELLIRGIIDLRASRVRNLCSSESICGFPS